MMKMNLESILRVGVLAFMAISKADAGGNMDGDGTSGSNNYNTGSNNYGGNTNNYNTGSNTGGHNSGGNSVSSNNNGGYYEATTIFNVVKNHESFDILSRALVRTGLDAVLNDASESYTLLAPTDRAFHNAFNALGVSGLSGIDDATLTDVLLYHVIEGQYYANQLTTGPIETVQGSQLEVTVVQPIGSTTIIFFNEAYVWSANIRADNGVIHAINTVLLPPNEGDDDDIIDDTGMDDDGNHGGNMGGNMGGNNGGSDDGAADDDGSDDLSIDDDGNTGGTSGGNSGGGNTGGNDGGNSVSSNTGGNNGSNNNNGGSNNGGYNTGGNNNNGGNGGYNSNSGTSSSNNYNTGSNNGGHNTGGNSVSTNNGGYYAPNLEDVISGDSRFDYLYHCLRVAGLKASIEGADDITIFAPVDAAFRSLLASLGVESCADLPKARLQEILLYHVVGDFLYAVDLSDGDSLRTLEGSNVGINYRRSGTGNGYGNSNGYAVDPFVDDAKILQADIEASNGVVHAISKVLIPPEDYGYVNYGNNGGNNGGYGTSGGNTYSTGNSGSSSSNNYNTGSNNGGYNSGGNSVSSNNGYGNNMGSGSAGANDYGNNGHVGNNGH